DLADAAVRADPYPHYAALREKNPVARTPTGGWLLTRYQDVHDVLRDPRFSTDPAHLNRRNRRRRPDRGSIIRQDSTTTLLLFQDPPDHTRIRSLVNQAFTPKRVDMLDAQIEVAVDDLFTGIEACGAEFDVISDIGFTLPVRVICDLVGVPFA